MDAENERLICMRGKKRGAEVWHYWNIHFDIDFHKRCICDYLILSPLSRVELHITLSPVLRQN